MLNVMEQKKKDAIEKSQLLCLFSKINLKEKFLLKNVRIISKFQHLPIFFGFEIDIQDIKYFVL